MLGKVMKYELRAAGRVLLPFFAAALVACGLLRGLFALAPYLWEPLQGVVSGFGAILGIIIVIAVVLLSMVYMVVRFYQAMVSSEATLSFTLPVKAGTHINGRLIVGSLYSLAGILLSVVCAIILIPGFFTFLREGAIPVSAPGISTSIPLSSFPPGLLWSFWGLMIASVAVSVPTGLLMVYVSIAVAPVFTRHRIVGSVAAYLVLNTVESLLLLPVIIPVMLNFGANNIELMEFASAGTNGDFFAIMGNFMEVIWAFTGIALALNVVFGVVHYFLIRYCLTKKLNLE